MYMLTVRDSQVTFDKFVIVDEFVGFVWVWNLVSDIKGGTQTKGAWEEGAEENIWRLEKTA
jgi:hypothetical protein